MALGITSRFSVNATLVANEFIDRYMAAANGEYVKVYLYLLRHGTDGGDIASIADALDHTEADVKRAIAYWERLGVLTTGSPVAVQTAAMQSAVTQAVKSQAEEVRDTTKTTDSGMEKERYSPYQLNKLSDNEEFAQLLYVAQKYTGKIFNHSDCERFAYLYDKLKMPVELLEYLVESCVQTKHNDTRYFEKVALNWHQSGIRTVEQAKQGTELYVKGYSPVMKAFGISGRNPGTEEHELIRKWFYTYLFSPVVVVEACNRTMRALHQPSFEYADKILTAWHVAKVRCLTDVQELDKQRESERKTAPKVTAKGGSAVSAGKKSSNQFHNFSQRETDYNSMVMDRLKERLKQQQETN